ncbi:ethanolamine utilization polyhedral-body-like protein EutL [Klebsiella pneumoniae]|nr:ethanolamine utilization polyhedral-body-like protein EutL [Klebsiella pneumoniae]
MPALDLIRPSVTAMRVIASVNDGFARELKLPSHIRSLGLITADSDDVTYIAADEATKQAMVEVVYGRSLYAGAAHGPSPTAGEVLIMLGGPNPAEVRAGLDAMMAHIEGGAAFQWANDAQDTAFSGARGVAYRLLSFIGRWHRVGRSDRLSGGAAAGGDVWYRCGR